MFQIIDPETNYLIFEGDIKSICSFAEKKKISAHIYFNDLEYLKLSKGNLTQIVGVFTNGKPYWIQFAPLAIGKC